MGVSTIILLNTKYKFDYFLQDEVMDVGTIILINTQYKFDYFLQDEAMGEYEDSDLSESQRKGGNTFFLQDEVNSAGVWGMVDRR